MTADVKIGPFKMFKPTYLKWVRNVSSFTDSAVVKIPAICSLKKSGDQYERVQTGLQFKEGMPAAFYAGYDGRNVQRFIGFVSRINFTVPLEIELEGYSYQLRKKLNFNRSYKNTTVKKILTDLVQGTDILLSEAIPDIPLTKATFENCSGINVLEWLKEKCLLTVYFNGSTLYAGLMEIEPKKTVKFRLGWNVIKDTELKFNAVKEFAEVRINLQKRKKDGKKSAAFVGKKDGQVKLLKSAIDDEATRAKIAEQARKDIINRGYEGSITAFAEPVFNPGDAVLIEDTKYPERTGRYFGLGVEGEFGPSGGRQKIIIGNSLGG